MNSSLSRKNTLNRIADALREPTGIPFAEEDGFHSFFTLDQEDLGERFANEFTIVEGKIFFCTGKKELFNNLKELGELKKWANVSCQTTALLKDFQLELLPFINKGSIAFTLDDLPEDSTGANRPAAATPRERSPAPCAPPASRASPA